MNRTLSLAALLTVVLATGVRAYTGDKDAAAPMLMTPADAVTQGDNCDVESYPWLDTQGQPLKG